MCTTVMQRRQFRCGLCCALYGVIWGGPERSDFGGAKIFGWKPNSMVSTRDPSVYFLRVILFFPDHPKKNHRPEIFSRSSWSPLVWVKTFSNQIQMFPIQRKEMPPWSEARIGPLGLRWLYLRLQRRGSGWGRLQVRARRRLTPALIHIRPFRAALLGDTRHKRSPKGEFGLIAWF